MCIRDSPNPRARNLTGGTPASQPPASAKESETIPEQLIMATRAARDMGTSFEKGKLLTYGRKSYPARAALAAIKELESAEGSGEGTGARRKSKHCIRRLCELAALHHEMWFGHWTQLSKVELGYKVTGKTRPALVEIWEQFKDDQVRVRLRSCRSTTCTQTI